MRFSITSYSSSKVSETYGGERTPQHPLITLPQQNEHENSRFSVNSRPNPFPSDIADNIRQAVGANLYVLVMGKDPRLWCPFHLAAANVDIDLLRICNSWIRDSFYTKVAKQLSSLADAEGWTMLHHAPANRRLEACDWLLEQGADTGTLSLRGGSTARSAERDVKNL